MSNARLEGWEIIDESTLRFQVKRDGDPVDDSIGFFQHFFVLH